MVAEGMMHERERSFGLAVGFVCVLIAGVSAWHDRAVVAAVLSLLAVTLIVPALLRPSLLRVPCAVWWRLAHLLGWVNSRVLLSIVFFGLLTPIGLIRRLGGWDPLRCRGRSASSWVPVPEGLRDPKHVERMY